MMFIYGFFTDRNKIFPYRLLEEAKGGIISVLTRFTDYKGRWYYQKTDQTKIIPLYNKDDAYNSLSLVTSMDNNDVISAKIISMNGEVVHQWRIDWFKIWSDASHIHENDLPKFKPGAHIHGALLLDNGDLVFNFDTLGLVRLDLCGNVVWRLPYRTHHSIYRDEFDNLWVPGQKNHLEQLSSFPNYKPPFIEFTLLKVSMDGEILSEISIMDLLVENNLQGLLYMSSTKNRDTVVTGDTLHVNDVETFPSNKEEGAFKHGDIMLSLRNTNTILIFTNEKSLKLKYLLVDDFVRQHDPDFMDGDTISIFDNNNIAPADYGHQSRILIKSFKEGQNTYSYYSGKKEKPFYTNIMGKHQWLPNGNLLITETMKGKAFEIDTKGQLVWEYVNYLGNNYIGMVEEVQRLDRTLTEEFFRKKIQSCNSSSLN